MLPMDWKGGNEASRILKFKGGDMRSIWKGDFFCESVEHRNVNRETVFSFPTGITWPFSLILC